MPSQAKLQDFRYGKLRSTYHQGRDDKALDRKFYVTDARNVTAKATSNEAHVANALSALKLDFYFQMSIEGGKGRAFGLVLDFLVMTVPYPTPIWVHGEHWHTGTRRQKDIYQQSIVYDYMKGELNPPIEIWGTESNSEQMALTALKSKGLI